MKKAYGAVAVALLVLVTAFGGGIGQAQQGAPEKSKETLNEVGQAIKQGLQNAREVVREEFARTREMVHDMGIMSRVYGRLHWDKALTTSVLDLKVDAGVVTLRGTVRARRPRRKRWCWRATPWKSPRSSISSPCCRSRSASRTRSARQQNPEGGQPGADLRMPGHAPSFPAQLTSDGYDSAEI